MKNILLLILLFSNSLYAATYYVATDGNDSNSGTISAPWATWNKAFTTATAGDTVYIRGGVYYSTSHPSVATSGTATNPISFFAYPGETPILDCSPRSGREYNIGIMISEKEHIHLKGLTIRNVWQSQYSNTTISYCWGVASVSSANITFEEMTVHNIAGRGFWITGAAWGTHAANPLFAYDTTRFINCDVYDLCDTISYFVYPSGYESSGWAEGDTAYRPGNSADGFKTIHYAENVVIWEGCRVWNYSDDGWDPTPVDGAERIMNNCWAMSTKKYYDVCVATNFKSVTQEWETDYMEGNGFKLNSNHPDGLLFEKNSIVITNSLAMYSSIGFYEIGGIPGNGIYYNNTAYKNSVGFAGRDGLCNSIYRNNLVYGSTSDDYFVQIYNTNYTESHNTWTKNGTNASWPGWVYNDDVWPVTDADFVYTDSLTLVQMFTAPRGADGSLPPIPIQLAAGSGLIDAGTDIVSSDNTAFTLTYDGTAPDIGAGGAVKVGSGGSTPIDPPVDPPASIRRPKPGRSAGGTSVLNGKVLIF